MNTSRKNYNADFCGSLPLHNINLIQPYGYLVVLNAAEHTVIQVSENLPDLLLRPVKDIIGTTFNSYVEGNGQQKFKTDLENEKRGDRASFALSIQAGSVTIPCVAIVHYKGDYLIIELERNEKINPFIQVYQEIRLSMSAIDTTHSVKELCSIAAKEVKKLSGFDKVMIYHFDENWNGTVLAEEFDDENTESYLGLTFPASDVPKQARDLYLKNPYRLIPTINYKPVGLFPIRNPATNAFLDLSDCNLRAVPAVHLEYLQNMNVTASMSTRIIVDGKLWGLISCHHKTEKNLSYEECSMFELISNVISAKIASIEHKESFDFLNDLRETRGRLIDKIYSEKSLIKGLLGQEVNAMSLFDAGGVALVQNGIINSIGTVPDRESITNLIMWLQNKDVDRVYSDANLPSQYHYASEFASEGSGLLAIAVDKDRGEYLLAFRPEVQKTVNWGGNPDEALQFEADGKKYHPRNSFKLWREQIVNTSQPWHSDELNVAEELRSFIFEYSSKFLNN